jgi:hypothetical protein
VKVWLTEPVVSVAVTWNVAVSPGRACEVSMIATPLGFVVDSDSEVMTRGLAGRVSVPRFGSLMSGICVIFAMMSCPAIIWPKIV